MTARHIETACERCLICHGKVKADETDYDSTLMVSVMLADDAVYDCVLVMHAECNARRIESSMGIELMTVTALGRAMVRAAEAGFASRPGAGAEPQVKRPEAKAARH